MRSADLVADQVGLRRAWMLGTEPHCRVSGRRHFSRTDVSSGNEARRLIESGSGQTN